MARRVFAALLEPDPPNPYFGPYVDPDTLVWPARFLIIEETDDGSSFLYHIDERGRCSDDWFMKISDAREAAQEMYGERLRAWEDIPPGVDMVVFGQARLAAIRGRT